MVTIHGLFEIRFWFVVLARKKQVLISNEACEAGTVWRAVNRNNKWRKKDLAR